MNKKSKQIMLTNETLKLLNKAKGLLYINEDELYHISDELVIKQSLKHLIKIMEGSKQCNKL